MSEIIAGIDEVGRGCLAGPVFACACILKENASSFLTGIKDSKLLNSKKREAFFDKIQENSLSIGIGQASVEEIETLNILQASLLAMKRAVISLSIKPTLLIIDGINKIDLDIPQQTIIGGDKIKIEIQAAAIIAKVTRDRLMCEFDKTYPNFGFSKHKGYGTALHFEKIKQFGITPIHRKTFNGVA